MTGYTLGADVSHYQTNLDMGQLYDDGVRYIVPKVAENGRADPLWAQNCKEAEAHGILVAGGYVYLRPGDDDAVIARTLDLLGPVPLALDYEQGGVMQATVDRWVKSYEDRAQREGLAYYGLYPPDEISDLFAAWPRWFPQYPGNAAAAPRLPFWDGSSPVSDWRKQQLIWQYSGTGRLPGVTGQIDLNRLACPIELLKAWVETGKGAWDGVAPFPVPAHPAEPAPAIGGLGTRDLYLHATGDDVAELQTLLNKLGAGLDVDGDDGPATVAAVKAFQASHPPLTVDGWAGVKETIPALIAAAS